jgi:modulator of FtsH protease
MKEWNDFYVAIAGASATLTGLIFVGVSISLAKILSIRGLPDRALLSLILLLNTLVISLLFLVPDVPLETLAALVLIIGVLVWLIVFRCDIHIFRNKQRQYKKHYLFNILIDQVATILFIVTGIAMKAHWTNHEYWIVPAMFVSIIKAVLDGWVLLVEINR